MKWNTNAIVKLLSLPNTKISTCMAGGDYDSTNVLVQPVPPAGDERISVLGFNTKSTSTNRDNFEIEMVEVCDGQDSRGGLNSSNRNIALIYAEVCTRLRKAGFSVVPKMNDYF
jgi:hypothetical protein